MLGKTLTTITMESDVGVWSTTVNSVMRVW